MPSPELLSQRLVEAINARNLEAMNRWLKHPRFDPERPDNAKALLASLHHDDAAVWLEGLLAAGVPLRKVAGGSEAIHEAARLGSVAAVRWLLDKGVPANASSHYGTTMLYGVLNSLTPVLPQHDDLVRLLWERNNSIEDLFGWQGRHLREFVGKAPASWVSVLLEAGWDPLASKPGEPSFWEAYLEKNEGAGAFRAAVEEYRLGKILVSPQEVPSGPKPRF